MRDAGIEGLAPWRGGSWFVPIDALFEPVVLEAILSVAVAYVDLTKADELGAISGGYVFEHQGVSIEPGCCGDLSDLEQWRAALDRSSPESQMLCIGHPWVFVRASGEQLIITEPSEQQDATKLKEVAAVTRAELAQAVEQAHVRRDAFAGRLAPCVAKLESPLGVQEIIRILLRGHFGA